MDTNDVEKIKERLARLEDKYLFCPKSLYAQEERMGYYNSFLVRVWTEDGEKLLRGNIQHVGTEEDMYFIKWEKMVDFILTHINWNIDHRMDGDKWESFYLQE